MKKDPRTLKEAMSDSKPPSRRAKVITRVVLLIFSAIMFGVFAHNIGLFR